MELGTRHLPLNTDLRIYHSKLVPGPGPNSSIPLNDCVFLFTFQFFYPYSNPQNRKVDRHHNFSWIRLFYLFWGSLLYNICSVGSDTSCCQSYGHACSSSTGLGDRWHPSAVEDPTFHVSCVQKVFFFWRRWGNAYAAAYRARSFSLRAGIAYADAYAGLRTPGFLLTQGPYCHPLTKNE